MSELKLYLRIDGSDDDSLLEGFITAARLSVEKYTNTKLIAQTWDMYLDRLPGATINDSLLGTGGVVDGALSEVFGPVKAIKLPFPPLRSVTHFKTFDNADTEYTFDSSNYIVDTSDQVGRLALRQTSTWPSTWLRTINGIQIRFICGYGGASDVPFALKQAIMEIAGIYYNSRGCAESAIPDRIWAALDQYRVYNL